MNETFDRALGFVLEREGGLVNNPSDPGGLTKWGISKRSYPDLDIENLTREQAAEIYKKDYWARCRCDDLPGPVAFVVFDEAVNQGPGAAIKDLQKALGVSADGVIGPMTMKAVEGMSTYDLLEGLVAERMFRYVTTLNSSPWLYKFAKGWVNRCVACMRRAMNEEET